ncbi:MAG: DUF5700 domain-containing putative Zn-dependent protease [Anaerolineales bacterium]
MPESQINLTTDNLDQLINHPEEVLANYEEFWETERVQFCTRKWAEHLNYEIPHDKVVAMIQEWADLSPEERENHSLKKNAAILIAEKDALLEKALPHLHSYFPPETDLSVDIHLTAFNPSRGFAMLDIVVNVQAPHWQGDARNILNAIVHEIGHVGHSYCRTLWTEPKAEPEMKHRVLDNLNSEGICTYIGYTAQSFAPAPGDQDYPQIEDPERVKEAFAQTNEIIGQIGAVPDEDIQKMTLDTGIQGRAYYVVGTTICKTIDEQLGREALIEAMATGPQFWANRYNQLVSEDIQLKF